MKKTHYLLSILAVIISGLLVVSCTVQRETVPQTPENRQTRFVPRVSPDPITWQVHLMSHQDLEPLHETKIEGIQRSF